MASISIGDLLHTLRAFLILELADSKIPDLLRNRSSLRSGLATPTSHLDTLNEIWWLRWWIGARKIDYEVRLNDAAVSDADIDWQVEIESAGLTINLEVKRRPTDVRRLDPTKSLGFRSVFENGLGTKAGALKFTKSGQTHVNVLALTLYCPIDREVQDAANAFVDLNSFNVDGVAIWSWDGDRTPQFAFHSGTQPSKADRVRDCLAASDFEDEIEIGSVAHPLLWPAINPTLAPA
ncbi:MAG: hypothetical protein ACI8UO_000400 [Verrucomicrobiales bacterium]